MCTLRCACFYYRQKPSFLKGKSSKPQIIFLVIFGGPFFN
jgi:hypothetical protein